MMITYIATNVKTGEFYIGSTTNFEWRKYCHLQKKINYPFQNALRKHPENFVWETFEDDSNEPVLEQALLDMFYGTSQCYNLNPIAGRPPICKGHTEETVSRMVSTRNTPEYKQSARDKTLEKFNSDPEFKALHRERTIEGSNRPEARKKNSDRGIERWKDPEYRERMRNAHRGKGLPWWVNKEGKTTRAKTSPGPDWKAGRKYSSEHNDNE